MKNNKKHISFKDVIDSFTFAEESIIFATTLSEFILKNSQSDFVKEALQEGLPNCFRKINWFYHPGASMEQANLLGLASSAFALLHCAECYFDFFAEEEIFAEEKENSDLLSAQMMLRLIRNSLGHPYVRDGQLKIRWNVKNKDYRKLYTVKKIGLSLNAIDLDGRDFQLKDLNPEAYGLESLIKLLNFLKEDLKNRAQI